MRLLSVQDLRTFFFLDDGELRAVDGVSFDVAAGEVVALVGESGCGKTIVAMSIIDLVTPPGRIVGGRVILDGEDLLGAEPETLRRARGRDMGIVFQEPGAALNPVFPVGRQIAEVLRVHGGLTAAEADREVVRRLGEVGIPEPEKRARSYPFELSGGMKQRAVIALATALRPRLLIADEPTTALDVTVQAEILDLLRDLRARHDMAILIISHDLGVVAQLADRVMVMYTGKIVEVGPTAAIFRDPLHPYTRALLASVARLGAGKGAPLGRIPGAVPDFLALPTGCTFHPRCTLADGDCTIDFPPLRSLEYRRECACYKAGALAPALAARPWGRP
jgi:oligopeptide/dipeptide ABC transporter ATP-binding protein